MTVASAIGLPEGFTTMPETRIAGASSPTGSGERSTLDWPLTRIADSNNHPDNNEIVAASFTFIVQSPFWYCLPTECADRRLIRASAARRKVRQASDSAYVYCRSRTPRPAA